MNEHICLVTGASSGIGEAISHALLAEGWVVYAAARRTERMAGLAEQGAHLLAMDVTDDASMRAGIDTIIAEQGRIDALVNNAGYGSFGALEDIPLDEARRQFEVNVFGLARLTQLVLPTMRSQHFGRIVNISSMGAHIYEPLGSWYHATKFAVNGLSDSLRLEVKQFGVDVCVIQPGGIRSEWSEISAHSLEESSSQGAYAKLAKQMATMLRSSEATNSDPSVVAKAVVHAVSARRPRSKYTVGSFAKPMVASRRLLPDAVFDRVLMATFTAAPAIMAKLPKGKTSSNG